MLVLGGLLVSAPYNVVVMVINEPQVIIHVQLIVGPKCSEGVWPYCREFELHMINYDCWIGLRNFLLFGY